MAEEIYRTAARMVTLGRRSLLVLLSPLPLSARRAGAAALTDAAGRAVPLPDRISRILPAGPPAAVLLAALAPELMLGWPMPLSDRARAALPPGVARLPQVPRLTGKGDAIDAVLALHPDLVIDYGTVAPPYVELADRVQARTGIPAMLLDGALSATPHVLRQLGAALGRTERAETLALLAEAVLALPPPEGMAARRVLYARGADGLLVAAPGTGATEVFDRLGWQVVAPAGTGWFRPATLADIRMLDPDVLMFADPAARQTVAGSAEWRAVRAVREGHAFVVPSLPFGWIEDPPSLNRLIGLAWLAGGEPATLAALFGGVVYGRVPATADLIALVRAAKPLSP